MQLLILWLLCSLHSYTFSLKHTRTNLRHKNSSYIMMIRLITQEELIFMCLHVLSMLVWVSSRSSRIPTAGNFSDQFSLLTSSLLVCILLAYWLFISTYKAHINALLCMTIFRSLNLNPYLTNNYLTKAVSVPFCECEDVFCEEQRSKGSRRSLVFVLSGRNQSEEVFSSWFPSWIYMWWSLWPLVLVTCPKFDNLLPELGLSISVLLC